MKKIGLFFGGIGNEAEVSVVSAQNVAANFDHKKFELVLIYWHKDGHFYKLKNFAEIGKPKRRLKEIDFREAFDIALPMTHGRFGEDGILQGIFERYRIKYAGCRVLSSALCMDKAACKKYLQGQKINQTKFAVIDLNILDKKEVQGEIEIIEKTFKLPIFVKPSNSGSSVGVMKVEKIEDLKKAIKKASAHDNKVVVEEGLINLREIEVAVVGNNKLLTSKPGELILAKEFYDYEEKYNNNRTEVQIPAKLRPLEERMIMEMAEKVYRLCECQGFSRIDFFIANNKIYLNEINTLPGFTPVSMFPMLMMSTGTTYKELITKIIELAY